MKILLVVIYLTFIIGCNQRGQSDGEREQVLPLQNDEVGAKATFLELDPQLSEADSLVFVFYKDPHGSDSLRYTRYYTQIGIADTALLHFFKGTLTDSTERLEKVKSCRSEGKVWCFKKGDIFQTVYFSTRDEPCSFLYIIRHGIFYYSGIRPGLVGKLAQLKRQAIEI